MLRVRGVRIGSRFLRTALGDPVAGAGGVARRRPTPSATAPRRLGRLEQESVDDAMASLGVHRRSGAAGQDHRQDPRRQPGGVLAARLVFPAVQHLSPHDAAVHARARAAVQARAALRQALVEESTRNLQSPPSMVIGGRRLYQPELSSVVVILPVASADPGQVDLLVVTRDVWSLRFNTDFESRQNALTLLSDVAVGEQPVRLAQVPVDGLQLRPGEVLLRPDLLRSQHPRHAADAVRARRSSTTRARPATTRATAQIASLRYPLYSLASKWGAGVDVTHANNVARVFRGNSLRLVDLAGTPADRTLPVRVPAAPVVVDANAVRSFRRPRSSSA